ncbi:MAG: HlyD family secretion protein [Coraliomargarita sp.]
MSDTKAPEADDLPDNEPEQSTETPTTEEARVQKDPAQAAKKSVRIGGLGIFLLIVASIVWYLFADRYTPSTSQARVDGYVVGVAPKVSGLVVEMLVQNNQVVEAGELLFRIDPTQYEIALAKAESDLVTTRRQIDAGEASVESARANVLSAKANLVKAEKDTARLTKLRAQDPGTISVRRVEISTATLEASKAALAAAEAQVQQAIEQMGGQDEASNAQIKAAQAAVDQAKWNIENTEVRASTRGRITNLKAEVGQYGSVGSPILTLVALQEVWIRAEFTENNLGHLAEGNRIDIVFDSLPGHVFEGSVASIGIGVSDGKNEAAGTLPQIDNNRDWLRQSQRFPVIIHFDAKQEHLRTEQIRIGGQATVIAYTEDHSLLNALGRLYIRAVSAFSYAY